MLKVLLADDERIILRGLHKLIDWKQFGMEITGEVFNGTELLQAIRSLKPDIVISDIVMPGMTGIEVIKVLKEEGLTSKVIFLSAFREFAYAQEALAFGAVDFLVKPVDQEKLEGAILKAKALVQEVTHSEGRLSRLAELELQQSKSQEKELLESLIENERVEQTAKALRDRIGDQAGSRFSVFVIEQEDIMKNQGNWEESDWMLLQFAIQNVMIDTLNEFGRSWVIPRLDKICAVFCHNPLTDTKQIVTVLSDNLLAYLRISVTFGLSSSVDMAKIAQAYREAETASGYRFFVSSCPFIYYGEIPEPKHSYTRSRDAVEKDLHHSLSNSSSEHVSKLCQEWVDAVSYEVWGNRELVVHSSYALLRFMAHHVSNSENEMMNRDELELTQRLWSFHTYQELGDFIHEELMQLAMSFGHRIDRREATQLEGVKKYIAEHFQEDIKLETIAGLVYMNPSYFSTFFKKHTGKNFKQYLTELRMKEGHRLLMHSDLMVYEVAEIVGYNNPRNFSDMFRKYYGKLPNDFRQG